MLLDLEHSFEELSGLSLAKHLFLPINAKISDFKAKIEKLKFPLWLKLNTSEHKLSLGGVKKCHNFEELEAIYSSLKKKFPSSKFLIQEDISGLQFIIGINYDKTFGKILLLGAGGSSVEEKKDIVFRVLPLTKEEILSALQQLKVYSDLQKVNLASLVELIEKLSKLDIKEADFNPVIINEKEAVIVDARISISDNE